MPEEECGQRPLRFVPVEVEPLHTVHFFIFDEGVAWETEVAYFDIPDDFMRETIEMTRSVIAEAKDIAETED